MALCRRVVPSLTALGYGAMTQVPVVVVEAEVDEPSEVDGGDTGGEAVVVAGHAPVADAAMTAGDEPGDGTFDHGPPLAVVRSEVAVAPGSAGFDELVVVFIDAQNPSVLGGCAAHA